MDYGKIASCMMENYKCGNVFPTLLSSTNSIKIDDRWNIRLIFYNNFWYIDVNNELIMDANRSYYRFTPKEFKDCVCIMREFIDLYECSNFNQERIS